MRATLRAGVPALLLLLSPALAGTRPPRPPVAVYVGTYTDTTSRGIYRFTIDPETGRATAPRLVAETSNPSFLALHPDRRFLYAVNEVSDFRGTDAGAVSAFSIGEGGKLSFLDQQSSRGASPCHIVIDRGGHAALVANYDGGNVAVLPIGTDGRVGPARSVQAHMGSGPNRERQEKAHAHGVALDPTERFAFVADLGADRVFVYGFDPASASLIPRGAVALDPGTGPRHVAFHPSGRFFYAIGELLDTVTAFRYDADHVALDQIETRSTLPAGYTGESTTAEIQISADGRFLYVSNRGHDSLAAFEVDVQTGRLTPVGYIPTGGREPRHFTLDPSGRFLLVANQLSDSIVVLRVDPATGLATPVGAQLSVPRPVCLLPVPAGS
jgi:6-phosphogluconolactonase